MRRRTLNKTLPVNEEIVFTIRGSSFSIPLSGYKTDGTVGAAYNWTVDWGDGTSGSYSGIGAIGSVGISHAYASSSDWTIKIKPNTNAYGWGRAFGFRNTADGGAGALTNKAKLISVTSLPYKAFGASATDTGKHFKSLLFRECKSLVTPAEEEMPDTVTIIGDAFMYWMYGSCTAMLKPPKEVMSPNVTIIGTSYRSYMFENCYGLTEVANEAMSNNVTSIDLNFRYAQWVSCNFVATAKEVMSAAIINIGDAFRRYQYNDMPYLLIGGHTHHWKFFDFLKKNNAYANMFGMVRAPMTAADTVPNYYVDATESGVLPITTLTPTTQKGYLTSRTGLAGYAGINTNWK